jgi:hypothetical protein
MSIETGTPEEGAGVQVIAFGYKHFVPTGLKSRIVRIRKS